MEKSNLFLIQNHKIQMLKLNCEIEARNETRKQEIKARNWK